MPDTYAAELETILSRYDYTAKTFEPKINLNIKEVGKLCDIKGHCNRDVQKRNEG